jgi:hypothetical protein
MAKRVVIKGSTSDSEIASQLTTEEILGRFVSSKEQANVWDAERDRLRKFIQEHIQPGRHGKFVLELKQGTPRVYSTSLGNQALQTACVIDMGLIPKPIKAGKTVKIIDDKTGEILGTGFVVDNGSLYTRTPPTNVNIIELPE